MFKSNAMDANPALFAEAFSIAGARTGRMLKVPGAEQNKISIWSLPAFSLSDHINLSNHDAAIVPVWAVVLFKKLTLFAFKDGHGQV